MDLRRILIANQIWQEWAAGKDIKSGHKTDDWKTRGHFRSVLSQRIRNPFRQANPMELCQLHGPYPQHPGVIFRAYNVYLHATANRYLSLA